MKLYVVYAYDYDEPWGVERYLHGVFDNYEKAKEYILEHYIDDYIPNVGITLGQPPLG